MTPPELADVVDEIAEAVAQIGPTVPAAWLTRRAHILRGTDSARVDDAMVELRGVVHGMGGLADLLFGHDDDRTIALIDELWSAVKP